MTNKYTLHFTFTIAIILGFVFFFLLRAYSEEVSAINYKSVTNFVSLNDSDDRLPDSQTEVTGSSSTAKSIQVDLANMKIKTMRGQETIKEYNVVTKGKPESYYETPVGSFNIKSKSASRYSNMGHVYMPYAMQFYGNFFVHGIPYYPDGTRVATSYSGGCIRVSDNDMREIYEYADIGTSIMIKNNNVEYPLDTDMTSEKIKNISTILFSLEVINQEKDIVFNDMPMKFKDLNYLIAKNDQAAIEMVIRQVGKSNYDNYINERLASMDIESDINNMTSIDMLKFINNIKNNKSFVLKYFN